MQIKFRGVQDAAQQKLHLLVPPPCLSRAVSRQLIKVTLSNGLVRKEIAPAFSARARIVSSGKAVMKMNGTRCPWASKRACSSTPLMAGIWTSVITHNVSLKWADCKNSSADANVWTVYPCDLRRLSVAARTDASSSMIEITGSLDTMVYLSRRHREPMLASAAARQMRREPGSENYT